MTPFRTDCEGFHRRDVLKIGVAGLLGLSLPRFLRLEARAAEVARQSGTAVKPKAKSVIMVWLPGGPATIDMWDLKPDAPAEIRGEFKQIATKADGVQICEHLPKMAQVMDKVTVVRSLNHTIPSHGPATVFMQTGNKPTPALQYPSLGSLCAKLLPVDKGVPPYVTFNDVRGNAGQSGYLGTSYNPFTVEGNGGGGGKGGKPDPNFTLRVRGITLPQGFSLDDLDKREKLLDSFDKGLADLDKNADLVDGLDTFHRQALEILRSDKTKKAFQLGQESPELRERYTTAPFGTGLLAARRLVEAGVRFVSIAVGGWDTHGQNFQTLKTRNLPALDQPLATLIGDLAERGLLDSTVVMVAGEFGRTPKINKNAGRDHWARSMACVLAGGGFKRGYVHGATDPQGMAPSTLPCTPDDVSSTIFHCLGVDPHLELRTPTGRPVQLFHDGHVVEKLLA
jgi:hypothetical protein